MKGLVIFGSSHVPRQWTHQAGGPAREPLSLLTLLLQCDSVPQRSFTFTFAFPRTRHSFLSPPVGLYETLILAKLQSLLLLCKLVPAFCTDDEYHYATTIHRPFVSVLRRFTIKLEPLSEVSPSI